MALLALEGFEGAGSTNGSGSSSTVRDYIESRYRAELRTSGNGVIRIEDGIGFGKALSWGGDSNADLNYIDIPFNKVVSEIFVGFYIKVGKQFRSTTTICRFRQSAYDENQVEMRIIENNMLMFFVDDFTQIVPAATNVFRPDVWTHIEMRLVISPTVGIIEVRANGVEIINETGLDTQGNSGGSGMDTIRFTGGESTSNTDITEQWLLDDVFILDTTGTDNITFLGPLKIETLLPTAEGATINFTPLSGLDNALMVDDNPIDEDTTYNSSADTASNKDLLVTANLTEITSNVRAVQVTNQAKVDQPSPVGLQCIVAEGTPTQGTGDVMEIADPGVYTRVWHVFEQNPDTSALWTAAEVDGMEIGYEID